MSQRRDPYIIGGREHTEDTPAPVRGGTIQPTPPREHPVAARDNARHTRQTIAGRLWGAWDKETEAAEAKRQEAERQREQRHKDNDELREAIRKMRNRE